MLSVNLIWRVAAAQMVTIGDNCRLFTRYHEVDNDFISTDVRSGGEYETE
jgi:hypothetical protein